jgi:prepilin-type N-terminal cleavage/methylation domain-containing protein
MNSTLRFPLTDYKSRYQGFTLIELLVVITLIGIVAGVAVLGYDDYQEQARYDATLFEMAEIRKALLQFRRDTGEMPCRVYRAGNYQPNNVNMVALDFTALAGNTPADYQFWCEYGDANQVDSALSMLQAFPYDRQTEAGLLWNRDTHRGWNGPYIRNNVLTDPWGNPYLLLDAELDYSNRFQCLNNGGAYDLVGGNYECLDATDPAITLNHNLDADIVRLVSVGPDGVFGGDNTPPDCSPAAGSDDFVLCILR